MYFIGMFIRIVNIPISKKHKWNDSLHEQEAIIYYNYKASLLESRYDQAAVEFGRNCFSNHFRTMRINDIKYQ